MTFAGRRTTLIIITILFGLVIVPFGAVFAQDGAAQGGVFQEFEVSPGERIEVPVEIRDVTELYAVDIEIRFDPDVIQIEDANPDLDGVQPALGTFLDAGLTLFNSVDNEEGVIRFVMSQVNPSEPKSGEGILLVLYALGAAEGESDLEVTNMELSDRFGEAIPVETVDGTVSVTEGAVESQSTAIPVQDPTSMVQVPTQAPTPIPTATSNPPTPTPDAAGTGDAQSDPEETIEVGECILVPETLTDSGEEGTQASDVIEEGSEDGFLLLDYWWIVLIVLVAVIAAAAYLLLKK